MSVSSRMDTRVSGPLAFLILLLLCGLPLASFQEDRSLRQRRFLIFPKNGIIQFALAIALPAQVQGKNVATNSGILININLPTNVSELRPPTRSVRSTPGHRGLNSHISKLLGINEEGFGECYAELECYRRQFAKSDYFGAEVMEAILSSMLLYVRMCGFPIPWLTFSGIKWFLFTVYDVIVFMFGIYVITSGLTTRLPNISFQDLCCLGIVCSQMTNGILITLHYIFFQEDMKKAVKKLDSISERILKSPLEHHEFFTKYHNKDRDIITLFTKVSILLNLSASSMYVLPTPLIDFFMGQYRAHLPIRIGLIGIPTDQSQYYELIIILQVLILVYSSIKKVGNDCIFLSFFKMQSSYLRYLSIAMRKLGQELVEGGGTDKDGKLSHWISLHQDVLSTTHDFVSLYSPIILLYYTNLICIMALGLFVQLKGDQSDTFQSVAIALWISVQIFLLFLQSAVADELREESENVATETYFIDWYEMKRDVHKKLPLILMLANHPIHLTAYRAVSFILNKETFLGFITSIITVYLGFSKIDDKIDVAE